MTKVAIFYGPEGGNTEKAAKMVASAFGDDKSILIPVKGATEMDLEPYKYLVFGGPTVGTHTWRDDPTNKDWDMFLTRLAKMNLEDKVCAVFGLGDHIAYAHHFVDDVGVMAKRLEDAGAKLVGLVPTEDYIFEDSMAQRGDEFLGLPLDEDYESDKTKDRISKWVLQLKKEFK